MDIGKSFTFIFEDKKWVEKILIGGLVLLIPIIGSILMLGYAIKLVRNVRNHDPEPLPEWDDWGGMFSDGLKLFIISLIWALPLIILFILLFVPMLFADSSDTASAIASIFSLCFSCLSFIYIIIIWLALPGIIIKFAEGGEISDGFKFGEIMSFGKKHVGEIIVVALVSWGAYLVASLVGSLLCVVGLIFTVFWASLVQYHLIAQIGLDEAEPDSFQEALPVEEPIEELLAGEEDDLSAE